MELDLVPRLGAVLGVAITLAVLALLLRWTYGHQKNVTLPTDDPDDPVATGLLTEVSRVPGPDAARVLRERLRAEGIRATTARADGGGWALLVFPGDVKDAKVVLSRRSLD
ncbi:hypothetical protein [Pseudonocardia spirodelae]|uniref:SPOR domain-containing protein n=1 Tax=Pseudonocardia spirodelae TaxID=3133431 RepID=A0ABU8TD20_9PSEU